MKPTKIYLLLLTALLFSCDKINDTQLVESIIYKSSFSTEERPVAISIDPDKGFVYVLNQNSSVSKIQKYSSKGTLKEIVIDFEVFDSGIFDRYSPLDMCLNNDEMYVMVKPRYLCNEEWCVHSGFCILHLDKDGSLIDELDFSELERYGEYSAMSYYDDYLYVTSGEISIKKINAASGEAEDILIPITNDRLYYPVSDMLVDSKGEIYLTGQGPWRLDPINPDVSICYITRMDGIEDVDQTFLSSSRTGVIAAMPNKPGLTIKDNNHIYLSTFYGRSLEIYNEENELIFQEEIKPEEVEETLPVDVALYGSDIYIADYENDMVHIYREE